MVKILLVDDDPSFVEEIKFLLDEKGYYVCTANDGTEAFKIAAEQSFDLVITDILMSKSHGFEVILHMRQYYPGTKVIAVTGGGWASPQFHLESAKLFGSDGALAKPFEISTLIREITRVLH
jgi:CheY-like chemotaxis protein